MTQREGPNKHALLLMRKASEDEALLDEVISSPRISDAVFGFHCQQAAEKLLKAALACLAVVYHRTHSIPLLIQLLDDAGAPLPKSLRSVTAFNPYAVDPRSEDVPPGLPQLDRPAARALIADLREWVVTRFSL